MITVVISVPILIPGITRSEMRRSKVSVSSNATWSLSMVPLKQILSLDGSSVTDVGIEEGS